MRSTVHIGETRQKVRRPRLKSCKFQPIRTIDEMTTAGSITIRRWLCPSLVDVFFVALFLALFAPPHGLEALLADGDTGWHIRTGELVIATGRVPTSDPFSFSRPGQPWFAWEWLSDVLFARLNRWAGLAGVAAAAGTVLALTGAALFARLLRDGVGLWVALAATLAAASASSNHYQARPHVFSFLLYTISVGWIEADMRRPGWLVWMLIPLAALWANLHGAFLLLPATLAAASLTAGRGGRVRYAALSFLTAAATLVNPYGWRLHEHLWQYLRSSWILDHVQEFQSPSIRGEAAVVFGLLLLSSMALAWRASRFEATLVLGLGFAALRSARHIPFFAIAAAPVVATAAAAAWRRLAERETPRSPVRVMWDLSLDFGRQWRASGWIAAAALLTVWLAAHQGAQFPSSRFPARAVDRNSGLLAGPEAPRVLTSDQWADYLIYRLYPRGRVFFDGRSDFYGAAIGADYRRLLSSEEGWRDLLRQYNFSAALLPRDWPLSTILDREPGWRLAYRDSVAKLFLREVRTP